MHDPSLKVYNQLEIGPKDFGLNKTTIYKGDISYLGILLVY